MLVTFINGIRRRSMGVALICGGRVNGRVSRSPAQAEGEELEGDGGGLVTPHRAVSTYDEGGAYRGLRMSPPAYEVAP